MASKHLFGMARDYTLVPLAEGHLHQSVEDVAATARELGLWWKPYGWGLHVQGLPPGDVPGWWVTKYAPAISTLLGKLAAMDEAPERPKEPPLEGGA